MKPSETLARAEARRLWRTYGFTSPQELVLEDLAYANGIVVMESRLDGAEARLIRNNTNGIIRVNEQITHPGRKRFAIAHEIGHWFLHARISQVLACTAEDMISKYKASPPELEANYFASELLMPSVLFHERIRNQEPSIHLIEQLAKEFTTSLTATAVRYVELRDDYCAVVFSQGGKIRWWRLSDSFGHDAWIESGSVLSKRTLARSLYEGGAGSIQPQEVDIDAWMSTSNLDCDSIMEHSMVLGRTGQTLSLLWLP